jgi:hypothetical protein
MRKIAVSVVLLATLSGCAVWDAFFMTPFDPSEYKLITVIRTDAAAYKDKCDDAVSSKQNAIAIAGQTQLFENYSQKIPHNKNSYAASQELNKIAQDLKDRYTKSTQISTTYCKLKFGSIENSASTIQHVLGSRPR